LAALEQAGLGHLVQQTAAVPLDELLIAYRCQRLRLPVPGGAAVSRFRLDAELVRSAVEAGVFFLPGVTAQVEDRLAGQRRIVSLQGRGRRGEVTACVVASADGLAQSSLKGWPEFQPRVAANSHVGIGALLNRGPSDYPAGCITMVVSHSGYVGLTGVEDGGLNLAAAVSPQALRTASGAAEVVVSILTDAGLVIPAGLQQAAWQGTPPLTRRAGRVAGQRLFVLGDATGYVEPFTGEGMAWGLSSAVAVAPLVVQACREWDDGLAEQWERTHRQLVQRRAGICRFLAALLRRPWAVSASLRTCRWLPWLPRCAMASINRQRGASRGIAMGMP
jgi:flavin-dependent dehydrogenase